MTKRAPGGAQRPWGGAELSEMSLVTCVSSVYPPLTAPSLTLQPPCSALASHLGCADSGCGAAGALGAALQEAALCPEGTWEGGGGGGPWVGTWLPLTASSSPEPGAVLPC